MGFQTVFKRYELKYLLDNEQKHIILKAIAPYTVPDKYGETTIRNIYYDTDNYRLIRHSIEKPIYKEKLRIRSYIQATSDSTIFVELKKKYDKVVYKRRLPLRESDAVSWLGKTIPCPMDTQISREIDYFTKLYEGLQPKVFLSYDRQAYFGENGFRITFDQNILCRRTDLSLCSEVYGTPLLDENTVLMELKCSGGLPLWIVDLLSKEKIYKTSFSKYGTAYEKLIFPSIYKNNITIDKETTKYELTF